MKLPRNFFKPLAIGAPAPLRELPVKLERMIHFVPPHIEKVRAKVPELIAQVVIAVLTFNQLAPGFASRNNAAIPETTGAEAEVPPPVMCIPPTAILLC